MAAEPVEADARAFGEVRVPREYVTQQLGRDYVLADGLLVALGQLSRGFYDVATEIVQLPTGENASTAVVTARVTVFDPETGRTLRTASGIGDASPANVGRMVAIHCLRMAETRAVARALRHLLAVGMTALEELGGGAPADDQPAEAPRTPSSPQSGASPRPVVRPPSETITVGGRTMSREQVVPIFLARLQEAERAGLQLAPVGSPGGPPAPGAPLQQVVAFSTELKRRLEARSAGWPSRGAASTDT